MERGGSIALSTLRSTKEKDEKNGNTEKGHAPVVFDSFTYRASTLPAVSLDLLSRLFSTFISSSFLSSR